MHVLPCCGLWWHRHFDGNDTSGSAYPVDIGMSIPQTASIWWSIREVSDIWRKLLPGVRKIFSKKLGSSWRSLQAGLNNASFVVKPRFSQGLWQWQALERYDTAEGLAHALAQGACRGWSSHGGLPPLTPLGPSSPTPSTPSLFTTCGAPGVGTRITCGGSWTGSLTCCHQGSGYPPRTSWCHTRAAASRRVGKKPRRNHAQRFLFAIGGASKVCCYDDSVMRHDHCCSQCPLFGAAIDHAWK